MPEHLVVVTNPLARPRRSRDGDAGDPSLTEKEVRGSGNPDGETLAAGRRIAGRQMEGV